MRAVLLAVILVGCSSDPNADDDMFIDSGGTVDVPRCNYALTTFEGAEAPKPSGTNIGTDPTPRLVHLGIVGDPKTSIVAQWRTVDETTTASVVRYAQGENLAESALTEKVDGFQFGYRATGTQIFRQHQAHLCGLAPDTAYSYQVGDGKTHWSPVYTFRTAPDVVANPSAEVAFAFVGDSRGGYDVWEQLVGQMKQRNPDLLLFSGDAVLIGITQPEWEEFLGRAEPLLATIPSVLVNGNHEANAINFYSQFAMPGDQSDFGFDYGFAHVTIANDTPIDPSAVNGSGRDKLAADLAASASARWKLLMHHKPMYCSGTNHGSNLDIRSAWAPLVDQYNVDLVLNGHEHLYEISKPLRGGVVQTTNAMGAVYVVAGGAGADLYTPGSDFWTQYTEMAHSAAIIRVRRDQLTLDSFHPDGTPVPMPFSKTK